MGPAAGDGRTYGTEHGLHPKIREQIPEAKCAGVREKCVIDRGMRRSCPNMEGEAGKSGKTGEFQISSIDGNSPILQRAGMRPRGVSKLDPYRDLLFELWGREVIEAEIRRILLARGCQVSPTTISTWFNRRVEAGEIPPRKTTMVTPGSVTPEPASLGLLEEGREDFREAEIARILRVLFERKGGWTASARRWALGPKGFDMPLTPEAEPDFEAYARFIGWRRLNTFGDMDFILFAFWTREFREMDDKLPHRRIRQLLRIARVIRGRMRDAVGLRTPGPGPA